MWSSSQSSSTQSLKKGENDSSAENSVKELTSDEEDDAPTPVNEMLDELGWKEATDEPANFCNKKPCGQEVADNKTSAKFVGPQHSCCHCMHGSYEQWCNSRMFHVPEPGPGRYPVLAKRNCRVCDHCGLASVPMFFEPVAAAYWDCSPHHHHLPKTFHRRKVLSFES